MSEVLTANLGFRFALSRATRRVENCPQLREHITDDQLTMLHEVLIHPRRFNEAGEMKNLVEAAREHCCQIAHAEATLPKATLMTIERTDFDWKGLVDWLIAHLPQIISLIASLIPIFFLLV